MQTDRRTTDRHIQAGRHIDLHTVVTDRKTDMHRQTHIVDIHTCTEIHTYTADKRPKPN